jgi:hypothetical protein
MECHKHLNAVILMSGVKYQITMHQETGRQILNKNQTKTASWLKNIKPLTTLVVNQQKQMTRVLDSTRRPINKSLCFGLDSRIQQPSVIKDHWLFQTSSDPPIIIT